MKLLSVIISAVIALSVSSANAEMADYTCRLKSSVGDVTKESRFTYKSEINGYERRSSGNNGDEVVHQYPNAQILNGKLVLIRPKLDNDGLGIYTITEVIDLESMDILALVMRVSEKPRPLAWTGFCIER